MKKFILIDHSVKDSGGHHLEYAKRVLKAAKASGFRTVLAVNKACENIRDPAVDVVDKTFSYGFWENFACERQATTKKGGKSLIRSLLEKKDDFIYEILFSQLGFAFQLLSEGNTPGGLARKYHLVSRDQKISLWMIAAGAVLLRLRHWQRRLGLALTPIVVAIGKPARILLRIAKFAIGSLLAPFILLYLLFRWKAISARFNRFSILFANECRHLLARVRAEDGDIIFIPTLGDVELNGIGLCSKAEALSGLHWHLLFRRNLLVGREPGYVSQMQSVQKTHIVFAEFKQQFKFGRVYFYTDTDPLTEQYNLLGMFPFSTLPIPHDEALRKISNKNGSLTISYIGDARDEKGFQHLAKLVADLNAAGVDEKKARFRFQSNFNVPLGEPGSRVAKTELALLSPKVVELLEGPFDSDEYASLVNKSDIILVPYDDNNYYARSSGIFAEALAAGVPVLYPAMSWMGRELVEENIRYWTELESSCAKSKWHNLLAASAGELRLGVSDKSKNPVLFLRYDLTSPQAGRYVKVSLYRGTFVKTTQGKREEQLECSESLLIDLRAKTGVIFHPLKKSGSYRIRIENFGASPGDTSLVPPLSFFSSLDCRLSSALRSTARQSVGYGYETIDELSAGVMDIVDHYASYQSRCRAFSSSWRRFHSSKELVRILSNTAGAE